ncbi:hypothetical protein BV898_08609 [Hypsibius exemplaris]|uniref:Uncharacterized protein n=1 Tax=Hypsibius exemplaris TaxID=2072580 RepID=A0A1W0WQ77_HYPEX|nr:hypothetical protein BV898_08609 [Hypsibius exemplaris]
MNYRNKSVDQSKVAYDPLQARVRGEFPNIHWCLTIKPSCPKLIQQLRHSRLRAHATAIIYLAGQCGKAKPIEGLQKINIPSHKVASDHGL